MKLVRMVVWMFFLAPAVGCQVDIGKGNDDHAHGGAPASTGGYESAMYPGGVPQGFACSQSKLLGTWVTYAKGSAWYWSFDHLCRVTSAQCMQQWEASPQSALVGSVSITTPGPSPTPYCPQDEALECQYGLQGGRLYMDCQGTGGFSLDNATFYKVGS